MSKRYPKPLRFFPKNPEKYMGNTSEIISRSSWELKLMRFLDSNSNVLKWCSEEVVIPYRSPIDGKIHRYFPDFLIQKKNKKGDIEWVLIEVKPKAQTKEPVPKKRISKRYLNEVKTWGINQAKWESAEQFCKKKNWKFMLVTEDDLGIK